MTANSPRVLVQHERDERIRLACPSAEQGEREERIGDVQQQDREREKQQVRLVPIDRQFLLVGPPAARRRGVKPL